MSKLEQAARALLAHWDTPIWKDVKPTADLMADLRKALAEQAEQSQFADATLEPMYISKYCVKSGCACHYSTAVDGEPVAVYTTPVRTKDLTDDEIRAVLDKHCGDGLMAIAYAVIAADREKNK